MVDETVKEITVFLNNEKELSLSLKAKLEKMVYADLKRIAANRLATESKNNTLTVTALVHEAFMRLDGVHSMTWKSRRHYFGAAAESMRRILIDKARYQMRQRREGAKSAIPLDEGLIVDGIPAPELVKLDDALKDLRAMDEELADVMALKYFAGLSAKEIAQLYNSTQRTMSRKIKAGRAWLASQI